MFDITNWELVCAVGLTRLILAQGNKRVLINKHTCEILLKYDFIRGVNDYH